MEPMSTMAIASIATPVIGGLIGNIAGSKDRKQQQAMIAQAVNELKSVGLPPDLSKEIIYQQFQQVGILTPQLEEDIDIAESELAKIEEDPALRDTQMQALEMFKQQAQSGMGAQERAALNEIRGQVAKDTEAKRQQIISDAQRRGQAGGGAELVAQLQATQGGADTASAQGDRLASMLAERIRQGAQDMSGAAQNLRSQDLGVEEMKARALDERNRFMEQNMMGRQTRNVGSLNDAQRYNLGEQQRISDANISLSNQEKLRQNEAKEDLYKNTLEYKKAIAGAYTGQAQAAADRSKEKREMFTQLGNTAGTAMGAVEKNRVSAQESRDKVAIARLDALNRTKGGV
jgi:hypothetical protein